MAEKDPERICFVISPIGGEETATRKWADQTIKHLIRPAAEPHGMKVMRADEEDRAGIITTHIIQRLVSSELVIADLTGRNPNVFYELAVRHVTRKPLIQIIRAEEEIPFDVQAMRTVKFELNDPDALEVAREALGRQIEAVLQEDELETPISQAVGQQLALESGDPGQVELAELSRAVQSLTAEVRANARQSASFRPSAKTIEEPRWVRMPKGKWTRVEAPDWYIPDSEDRIVSHIEGPDEADDPEISKPRKKSGAQAKGRSKGN